MKEKILKTLHQIAWKMIDSARLKSIIDNYEHIKTAHFNRKMINQLKKKFNLTSKKEEEGLDMAA
jgi:glutamate/tyrosine decarboxylase-like PLP-dependent enzyme